MTDQEINEAVAKKLGWRIVDMPSGNGKIRSMTKSNVSQEFLDSVIQITDFCGDIKEAWKIVSSVEPIPYERWFRLEKSCFGEKYTASWRRVMGAYQESDMAIAEAESDTAPMAICLAFLKMP